MTSTATALNQSRWASWFKSWRGRVQTRRLRVTREGKWYLGITVGVGLAAVFTGNNLLYLLLGLLLALIIISGVMSEISLHQLSVVRRLPLRAQVGRSHLVEIEVFNNKTNIPSYAIEVEDLREGQPADKRCFFLKISPSSTQVAAYRRTPQRRGRDRHVGFRVATRFPFGFFEKSREIPADGDLVIYPAVDPVRCKPGNGGAPRHGEGRLGRGSGDELIGIRLEREGDDPRDIYWKKSTVPTQRVIRERAREHRPDVTFQLDVVRKTKTTDEPDAAFERAVRDLASRAVAHIKAGDRVSITTNAGQRISAERNVGIDPLLRFLALVEQIDPEEVPERLARRTPHEKKQAAE